MLPTALLLLLAKATIVLVAALGIARALRRAAAGARHLVWLATLAALLLVPALAMWAPLPITVLPPLPEQPAPQPTTATPTVQYAPAPAPPTAVAAERRAPRAERRSAPSPERRRQPRPESREPRTVVWALALWAAVALAIGASLANAWLAVRRILRRAQPLGTRDWLDPLWEVSDRLGLDEPPRLLRSAEAKMPFACGIAHPTVVLPAESDAWTLDRRRAVLLHELAHVRRRDLAGHTLARLVCAAYWFHPLVWTAAKRLRAESERACDDLALACGARAADYAEHLLDIVASVRRDPTPLVALAMARRTEFEGRMLDILDPERRRTTPSRAEAASLVGALALIAVVVGAATPAPAAPARAASSASAAPSPLAASDAGIAPREVATSATPASRDTPDSHPAGVGARQREVREQIAHQQQVSEPAAPGRAAGDVLTAQADTDPDDTAALLADSERERASARVQNTDERPQLLAKVLRSDTSAALRRIAAWGLAEYAERPVAATALAEALRKDRSASVREMAAWALAEGHGEAAAHDALGAALRTDADAKVRATAAWALGNAGDRSSLDALIAALGDPSAEVRTSAVWALGSVEPRQAPRALVAMLRDKDPQLRELTAWALYSIEDPETIPALQAALQAERDTDLQVAYIRALATLGEKSVDALRGLLESPDPRVKAVAVRALAGGDATGPWPWPWPDPRPSP